MGGVPISGGNNNRVFHQIDWAVMSELQLWLRRKHQLTWRLARKRWNSGSCTSVVGCTKWLDAGKLHVHFDEGAQETWDSATRLGPTLPKPLLVCHTRREPDCRRVSMFSEGAPAT
jgi:hypothetical protein